MKRSFARLLRLDLFANRASTGRRRGRRTVLSVEGLEDRRLLAATLVKDINTTSTVNGSPAHMASLSGSIIFQADDGVSGTELWKSDGTSGGTFLLKDIFTGSTPVGSPAVNVPNNSNPTLMTTVGGVVFFVANDGTNGTELWKTDGTSSGTVLVKNINTQSGVGSNPTELVNVNGVLYFSADDGVNGRELWKSDGTSGGTVLVKDIVSGSGSSSPEELTNVGGTLFFSADDGVNGRELWKSNGLAAGTTLVANIRSGSAGSNPDLLYAVGSTVYFAADNGTHGIELWKSSGTGAALVKDIRSGVAGWSPTGFVNVGGTIYFAANDGTNGNELWKTDGTTAGTTLVKDINTSAAGADSNPSGLTNLNGTLVFRAHDGLTGNELWKSDGTSAGTTQVINLRPAGGGSDLGSDPGSLTSANGLLYFSANDGTNGVELWQSDGTAGGTVQVANLRTNPDGSNPVNLTQANKTLFFAANNGTNGVELFSTTLQNQKPVAVDDAYVFEPGVPLVVAPSGVLSNDQDPESLGLSAVLVSTTTGGVLSLGASGDFTYTPGAFNGRETFTYRAQAGSDLSLLVGTVTLTSRDYQFIDSLYSDLLGRMASSGEISVWVAAMSGGASRQVIANAFLASDEYRAGQINNLYQTHLNRPVDAGGLSAWLAAMNAGLSTTGILERLLASDEYLRGAGSETSFVSKLYIEVLGRTGSVGEVGFWRAAMFNGLSRQDVANRFLSSTEYRTTQINAMYLDLLGRPVDAGGLAAWLAALGAGASLDGVRGALLASDEYFNSL